MVGRGGICILTNMYNIYILPMPLPYRSLLSAADGVLRGRGLSEISAPVAGVGVLTPPVLCLRPALPLASVSGGGGGKGCLLSTVSVGLGVFVGVGVSGSLTLGQTGGGSTSFTCLSFSCHTMMDRNAERLRLVGTRGKRHTQER